MLAYILCIHTYVRTPLYIQDLPGVLQYVSAVDIPAGGQNNALSSEFFEPEEVLACRRGASTMFCHVCVHVCARPTYWPMFLQRGRECVTVLHKQFHLDDLCKTSTI